MWGREELVAQAFYERYLRHENLPFELDRVANAVETKLGVEVYLHHREMPDEITAQLSCGDHAALVYINSRHNRQRQRFGVVHEFGHLLLGHTGGILMPGVGESSWENDAANNFAAALLMPLDPVLAVARKFNDSLSYLVFRVAQSFDVSIEAAVRRVASIGSIPGLFALVNPEPHRLDWEYHSPSVYLDRRAFRLFLTKELAHLRINRRKLELDYLEVMGCPFRVEAKPMAGKYLITCQPFMARQHAL